MSHPIVLTSLLASVLYGLISAQALGNPAAVQKAVASASAAPGSTATPTTSPTCTGPEAATSRN